MDLIESETSTGNTHAGDGWKEVVNRKRNQKKKPANGGVSGNTVPTENLANGDNVFRALTVASDVEDESNCAGAAARNENLTVSLSEAAAKIDISRQIMDLSKVSFPWEHVFKDTRSLPQPIILSQTMKSFRQKNKIAAIIQGRAK